MRVERGTGRGALLLGVLLVALVAASPVDEVVHDWVFRHVVSHEVRLLANGVTLLGTTWAAWGLGGALAVAAARAADATLWRASLGGVAAVAVGGLATQGLKHVVCRARPGLTEGWGIGPPGPGAQAPGARGFFRWPCFGTSRHHSFPSGHATAAFALAGALAPVALAPAARRAWLGAAVAVAVSRVVLNAHFLSDVLGGMVVGWWAAGLGRWSVDRLAPRLPTPRAVRDAVSEHFS
jgi:membrane-associated phospholipid phosphatase